MTLDTYLHNQGKNALAQLMRRYQRGVYRVIRDPEGVISVWAIQGTEKAPFSVTFADQGRIGTTIEQMSPAFVKAFLEYVNKSGRQ